ncbi:hypothetical protein HDU86_000560 [Geranomyces michiganensis]|nr:hypothetical protein HDU86_000560 [Geranomyces michiganensis]
MQKDDKDSYQMTTSTENHELEQQDQQQRQQQSRSGTPAAGAARFAGAVSNNAVKGLGKGFKAAGSVADDFRKFVNRGNVVDLAVGVVVGGAFTSIVTSVVVGTKLGFSHLCYMATPADPCFSPQMKDVITPLISLVMEKNMENNYIVLRCPPTLPNATDYAIHKYQQDCSTERLTWGTVAEAQKAGAVTWNWGKFLSTIINFIIISAIIFFLVKVYTAARRPQPKPVTTKECLFCYRDIPLKAKRCPECTSHVEEVRVPESVVTIDSPGSGFPFMKALPNALPFVKGKKGQ